MKKIIIVFISGILLAIIFVGILFVYREEPSSERTIKRIFNNQLPKVVKIENVLPNRESWLSFGFKKYIFDNNIDKTIFKKVLNDTYRVDIKIFIKYVLDNMGTENDKNNIINAIDFDYEKDEIYFKIEKDGKEENNLVIFNTINNILYYLWYDEYNW